MGFLIVRTEYSTQKNVNKKIAVLDETNVPKLKFIILYKNTFSVFVDCNILNVRNIMRICNFLKTIIVTNFIEYCERNI